MTKQNIASEFFAVNNVFEELQYKILKSKFNSSEWASNSSNESDSDGKHLLILK